MSLMKTRLPYFIISSEHKTYLCFIHMFGDVKRRERRSVVRDPEVAFPGDQGEKYSWREMSNLTAIPVKPIDDILICCLGESTADSSCLVVGIPLAQPLGAVVEGISKRFVGALEGILTGHKHLCLPGQD